MLLHDLQTKSLIVTDTGEIEGIAWGAGPDAAGDRMMPGTFAAAAGPIAMLWQHRKDEPIGVWDSIEEKADGLHVRGRLQIEHSPRAREAQFYMREGVVRGLSIGFYLERKAAPRGFGTGRDITAAHGLQLKEISIVTRPSHSGARVTSMKSANDALALAAALERFHASLRA